MPTFLQPVVPAKRCFLFEVLLWVAFQRLPIVLGYTDDGKEIRETDEVGDYEVKAIDRVLSDDETKRVGIPAGFEIGLERIKCGLQCHGNSPSIGNGRLLRRHLTAFWIGVIRTSRPSIARRRRR